MELGKSFASDLGFLHNNMASCLPQAVVLETILASHRSLGCLLTMAGFLLKDTDTLGNSQRSRTLHCMFPLKKAFGAVKTELHEWKICRFPFAELHRNDKTELEAKDGSDTEDDDDDEDAEEADDDDAADEDFSGDDGGDDDDDDEEADPDEDPAANGNNQGSDDDDDDDEQDNDDEDEDDEEEEEDEDEEEQPPAKKRK